MIKLKRFLMWHLLGVRVPYTRAELKAAGYTPIDNSDLIDLLRRATLKAKEMPIVQHSPSLQTSSPEQTLQEGHSP